MSTPIQDSDRSAIKEFIEEHWHAPHVCIIGRLYRPHEHEGYVVREQDGDAVLVGETLVTDGDPEAGVRTLRAGFPG